MTQSKIVAFDADFTLHEDLRPGLKSSANVTGMQQFRKTVTFKDIPEPKVGITGHPAVTLRHMSSGVDAHKFISAVFPPDTGNTRVFTEETLDQFVKRADFYAVMIAALHPDLGEIDQKLAQPIRVQRKCLFDVIRFPSGKRRIDLKVAYLQFINEIGIKSLCADF